MLLLTFIIGAVCITIVLALGTSNPTEKKKDNRRVNFIDPATQIIANKVRDKIMSEAPADEIQKSIENLVSTKEAEDGSKIRVDKEKALLAGVNGALKACCSLPEISKEKEYYMYSLLRQYNISQDNSAISSAYGQFVQRLLIQDLKNNKLPHRYKYTPPVNLEVNEIVVLPFFDVALYEERKQRRYVGGSKGVSIRLAKGLTYRTGGSKGYSEEYTYWQEKCRGQLIFTDKNIYFYSIEKSIKLPYKKVVAYAHDFHSLTIHPSRANAKPLYFSNLDGEFAEEVAKGIMNLR